MKLAAAFAIFLVPPLLTVPKLVRHRRWRELFVFSLIAVITGIYLICYAMDIKTFSPLESLSLFVQKALGLNYALWQGSA